MYSKQRQLFVSLQQRLLQYHTISCHHFAFNRRVEKDICTKIDFSPAISVIKGKWICFVVVIFAVIICYCYHQHCYDCQCCCCYCIYKHHIWKAQCLRKQQPYKRNMNFTYIMANKNTNRSKQSTTFTILF